MLFLYIFLVFFTIYGTVSLISNIILKTTKNNCGYDSYLIIKLSDTKDIKMELQLLSTRLNWCNLSDYKEIIVYNSDNENHREIKMICDKYKLKYITSLNDL